MKTEITTTTYRGHEITVITHQANGASGTYYTQHNDVEGVLLTNEATDNHENTIKDRNEEVPTIRIWATPGAAQRAAEQTIEDTLGHADSDEIQEAAYDLANSHNPEWIAKNSKRLADAIESACSPDADRSANTLLQAVLKGLSQH